MFCFTGQVCELEVVFSSEITFTSSVFLAGFRFMGPPYCAFLGFSTSIDSVYHLMPLEDQFNCYVCHIGICFVDSDTIPMRGSLCSRYSVLYAQSAVQCMVHFDAGCQGLCYVSIESTSYLHIGLCHNLCGCSVSHCQCVLVCGNLMCCHSSLSLWFAFGWCAYL